MSLKGEALKAAVVERLVVAADEIFGLFERTLVEYKAEILRSKLLQRPHVVLYRQDIQTVAACADIGPGPTEIKKEEDTALKIPLPSVKTEENVNSSTIQKHPAEENRRETFVEQCEREEPSCNSDLFLGNNKEIGRSSATDNSSYREFTAIRSYKYDGKNLIIGHRKNSVEKNDHRYRSYPKKRLHFIYRCQVCGMKFRDQYSLIRHVRRIHDEEKHHTCSVCQRGFFQKWEYVIHMRIHTGERPFSCSDCGKSFMSKRTVKRHKCSQRQSPDRLHGNHSPWEGSVPSTSMFAADIQTVIVGADGDPERTDVKQEEDSPFLVPFPSVKNEENVSKSNVQKAEVDRQESFEQCEGEKPGYSVDLHLDNNKELNSCSGTDKSSRDLKDKSSPIYDKQKLIVGHRKNSASTNITSNDQRHRFSLKKRLQLGSNKCSVCGKKFVERQSLSRHIRQVHNEEKPHTCSFCQKGFYRKFDHDIHMRIHTGERPFSCSVCGKSYRAKKCLTGHKCSQRQSVDYPHQNHSPWKGSVPNTLEKELFDIQTVTVGADSGPEPAKVKQEEDSPIKILLPSVKTEENMNLSTLQKDPAESRQESTVEEPGCSVHINLDCTEQLSSCSDSDNLSDWNPIDKSSPEYNGKEVKAGHSKNSKADNIMSNDQLHGCARTRCFKSFESRSFR